MPGFLQKQRWTRLEVAIWLFGFAFIVISGILLVTQTVGDWVLPVGGVIAAALGMLRYRADAEQRKRNADDRGE
jgi:hypothetical protein